MVNSKHKSTKIWLAGLEGFDDEGNPLPQEEVVTTTDEVETTSETSAEQPQQVTEDQVRVVADQPVIDAEPISEDEATINEEIERETVAIEELEETVDATIQQQDNISDVSDQVEDTIQDVSPSIEEGGISNEGIRMILSMRKRIGDRNAYLLGGEAFETRFGVEGFGHTKSVRLSNSKAIVDSLATEAVTLASHLKDICVSVIRSIIDLVNKIINWVDFQGRRAAKLKDRIAKLDSNYKEGVEFESGKIAKTMVKNKNGDLYDIKDFAQTTVDVAKFNSDLEDQMKKLFIGMKPFADKLSTALKAGEPAEGAVEATKEWLNKQIEQMEVPKLFKGDLYVGIVFETKALEDLVKESVEPKTSNFKTVSKSELTNLIGMAIDASGDIKKSRDKFGTMFQVKNNLGKAAERLLTSDKNVDAAEYRRAANEIVKAGNRELSAMRDLIKAASKGVGAIVDFVDLSVSKGSKGGKSDSKADDSSTKDEK